MTPREFCYWLQGFFELSGLAPHEPINAHQKEIIRNHLNLVFIHSIDDPDPTGELQATHDGVKPPKPSDTPFYRPPGARC